MIPMIRNLVLLLLLAACKPALHTTMHSAPEPNRNQLFRILLWDSEEPGHNMEIHEYHYDSLNRVTEIRQYLGDSVNGTLQLKFIRSKKCFYNAGEQLPYKSNGFCPLDSTADMYYLYDSTGRMTVDSARDSKDNSLYLNRYYWYNDKVIKHSTIQASANGYILKRDSSVINNHNITANVLVSHGFDHIAFTHTTLTYDDKVNPINALNIGSLFVFSWPYLRYNFRVPGYSKNNTTAITLGRLDYKKEFILKYKWTYTYKYNSAGLPVECEISEIPSRYKNRIQYFYRN